jgi:thymidine kinase
MPRKGNLSGICGPMVSGTSRELSRLIRHHSALFQEMLLD